MKFVVPLLLALAGCAGLPDVCSGGVCPRPFQELERKADMGKSAEPAPKTWAERRVEALEALLVGDPTSTQNRARLSECKELVEHQGREDVKGWAERRLSTLKELGHQKSDDRLLWARIGELTEFVESLK